MRVKYQPEMLKFVMEPRTDDIRNGRGEDFICGWSLSANAWVAQFLPLRKSQASQSTKTSPSPSFHMNSLGAMRP